MKEVGTMKEDGKKRWRGHRVCGSSFLFMVRPEGDYGQGNPPSKSGGIQAMFWMESLTQVHAVQLVDETI
jgi:hypothetical protein